MKADGSGSEDFRVGTPGAPRLGLRYQLLELLILLIAVLYFEHKMRVLRFENRVLKFKVSNLLFKRRVLLDERRHLLLGEFKPLSKFGRYRKLINDRLNYVRHWCGEFWSVMICGRRPHDGLVAEYVKEAAR